MKVAKPLRLSFLSLLLVDIAILLIKCLQAKAILASAGHDFTLVSFNALQKPISMINIFFFIGLLIMALWLYYSDGKKIYVYLTTLTFVWFTLFNYVTLNRMFFNIGEQFENKPGSYWLLVCVGLFYIFGGLVVMAIGLNTVHNLFRRSGYNENEDHPI
jgi:hypothetical protein